MERFNADSRIFVFILSTRSGGLGKQYVWNDLNDFDHFSGINLTGADTVIFYDSDWNPTMDAQAQDRCHRIGQTRDVNIYRLISERTIEENILRKARQKSKLGEIAIEDASFTPDFFKSANLREIFDLADDADTANVENISRNDVEQAMLRIEDTQDAFAARKANDEVRADLAEFDETAGNNLDYSASCSKANDSKVDQLVRQVGFIHPANS